MSPPLLPPPSLTARCALAALLGLSACGPDARRAGLDFPEPALWLMGNLDASELRLREQVLSLEDWWIRLDPEGTAPSRSFEPGPLTEDLAGSTPPPPADATRRALTRLDPSALDRHRRALATAGCADPRVSTRSFIEGDCLPDGACRRARTEETTTTGQARVTHWREIDLLERREALIGRWHTLDAPQHLGLDLWVVDPEDSRRTHRLAVVWWADDGPEAPADALDASLAEAATRVQGGCDAPF